MTKKLRSLTRRDFIRGTVGAALTAPFLGRQLAGRGISPAGKSLVIVARDQNAMDTNMNVDTGIVKKLLDNTVMQLSGKKNVKEAWLSFIKPEDTVGLVSTAHLNPTHPELVDAVKQGLTDAGIPDDKIIMAQSRPDKPRACTALIALPALKAHWLTGIGTVLKLYIMYSGNPSRYHNEDNTKLGEIWNLPFVKGKTKLVLVDALYPLCDKGPQPDPRYKWAYNGLIAGTDPVAVETVCLRIITEKRKALRGEPWPLSPPPLCVEAADTTYGLGNSKMSEIDIRPFGWDADLLL